MDWQNYLEALEQYKCALQLEPNSGEALAKKSVAMIDVDDFNDAENDADKAIGSGGEVRLPIVHIHTIGHSQTILR